MRKRRIFVGVGLAVVGLSVAVFFPQRLPSRGARIFRWRTAPQASSQCWALLIGVDDYAEAEKLRYCGADMRALRDQLVAVGFPEKQVIVLDNRAAESKYQPQKSNIERQLELVLDAVEPEDLLVLAFSGHGAHMDGKSYLCPADARLDDSGTMISADAVYSRLEKSRAAMKLLLVDACRNDPRRVGGRSIKTVDNNARQFAAGLESAAQAPERPRGILLLTSCAPGQISMEDSDFGHGVFMHYLLEGLRGKADAEGRGHVSMIRLYDYTKRETKAYVLRKYNSLQTPALTAKDLVDFDFGSGWSGPTGQAPSATVARIEPPLPQTRPEPETRPTTSTTPRPQPSSTPSASGTVVETMNAAGYTYVQVDTGREKVWAAAPEFQVKVGDQVVVPEGTPMYNYHSNTLNRDFAVVYFVGSILNSSTGGAPAHGVEMPAGHPPAAASKPPVQIDVSGVKKAEGGLTVEEVFSGKANLAGKDIVLHGKVVKFNAQIMGKNWLHVRDGSGDASARTNDLSVTTDDPAKVGDTVLIKGKVVVDKDFGLGYRYDVIIEDAKVTVE